MNDCSKFWCVNTDCFSYSNGFACPRCDKFESCCDCILYSELDDDRPNDCAIREDGILYGYWSTE